MGHSATLITHNHTTFMYRSRNLSVDVGGKAAWGREPYDQVLELSCV